MDGASATHLPDFSLPASTGQTLSLDSFEGKVPMAILFLADLEEDRALVSEMNEALPDFGDRRSQLLTVARATASEVRNFVEENGIVMPILADAAGAMARDYGAEGEAGRRRMAVIADAEGRIVRRLGPLGESGVADMLLTTISDLGLEPHIGSAGRG